ncbi:MAG: RNA polymerase sigma factor [Terriglobales bacterium]
MANLAEVANTSVCGKDLHHDFDALVSQYRPRLYRTALRQLGNPDDAEDALQEALLAAYRHLDQFQGRARLSTWLTRIVINAAREQQRRRRNRPAVSLEALPLAGELFPDRRPTPEARCSQRERRERLARLLARLSPPLRSAVQLYELEGLSCRQAAARLGIKPATLKCRLFRGRARLALLAGAA